MSTTARANQFNYLRTNNRIGKRQKSASENVLWLASKNPQILEGKIEPYYQANDPKVYYEYNKTIDFSINDYKISLPRNLKGIADSILDSRCLLELEYDWDEEGADATNLNTYRNAIRFIVNYSTHILNRFDSILEKPYIDITRDGSISVFWNTTKASFFIIFGKDKNEYAYYYGQEKETDIAFKYKININDSIDLITLTWMRQNLI